MTFVRYPPHDWPAELDEHEESFIRLDDHLTSKDVRERLAHIDRLAVSGSFTDQPQHRLGEARSRSWLVMLLVPIVALCAVGLVFAVLG